MKLQSYLYFLLIISTWSVLSCKKDGAPSIGGNGIVCQIAVDEDASKNDGPEKLYSFDSQKRIIEERYKSLLFKLDANGNPIPGSIKDIFISWGYEQTRILQHSYSEDENGIIEENINGQDTIPLNSVGRVEKNGNILFEYNTEGFLVHKIDTNSSGQGYEVNYFYENNNLVKEIGNSGNSSTTYIYEYYTDQIDQFHTNEISDQFGPFYLGLFGSAYGKTTKNLLKSISCLEDKCITKNFSYKFDSIKRPVEIYKDLGFRIDTIKLSYTNCN